MKRKKKHNQRRKANINHRTSGGRRNDTAQVEDFIFLLSPSAFIDVTLISCCIYFNKKRDRVALVKLCSYFLKRKLKGSIGIHIVVGPKYSF